MPAQTTSPLELPEPTAGDRQLSAELSARIREAIRAAGGSIGFDAYMELALYSPELGYYSSGRSRFGAAGDFVTAPEISDLFGRILAHQALEVFATLAPGDRCILEVGAGSGTMARDLLAEFEQLDANPDAYLILERSAGAREQQRQTLGPLATRVRWLDDFPESGFRGLVTGNEFLDALPAVRFVVGEAGLEELRVGLHGDAFYWQRQAFTPGPVARELEGLMASLGGLPLGYISEYAPAQAAWVRTLASRVEAGAVLLFDYGYPRREFYHPQRSSGTLACHYRHRMHEDPFRYPGLQDLSVHVDFTAIAEAAIASQLHLIGYTTQAQFLMSAGLLELAGRQAPATAREQAVLSARIQRLTLPSQLGEAVKVMAISPDPTLVLSGFSGRDLSVRL